MSANVKAHMRTGRRMSANRGAFHICAPVFTKFPQLHICRGGGTVWPCVKRGEVLQQKNILKQLTHVTKVIQCEARIVTYKRLQSSPISVNSHSLNQHLCYEDKWMNLFCRQLLLKLHCYTASWLDLAEQGISSGGEEDTPQVRELDKSYTQQLELSFTCVKIFKKNIYIHIIIIIIK